MVFKLIVTVLGLSRILLGLNPLSKFFHLMLPHANSSLDIAAAVNSNLLGLLQP